MLDSKEVKDIDNILGEVNELEVPSTDVLENELKGGEENIMPQEITDLSNYQIPQGDSAFLKMLDGDNKIRLCSNPMEVVAHEISGKGERFKTAPCTGTKCELCKQSKKRTVKFGFLVLNRKDSRTYVYEAPVTVFRQIVAYATNPDWGNFLDYDLTINKQGQGLETQYTVMASPKKPLSDEEQQLIAESSELLKTTYALS